MKPHIDEGCRDDHDEDAQLSKPAEQDNRPLKKMIFIGPLSNPFYRFGRLLFSMQVDGYPDVEPIQEFLKSLDHKRARVVIEEVGP